MDGTLDSSNKWKINTDGSAVFVGNVASGATDSGNPVKVGGVYNTALPTLTNGQRGDIQLTANARMIVDASGVAVPVTDNSGSLTVDAPVATPLFARLSDGSAALVGQKAMTASLPVVVASDQSAIPVSLAAAAASIAHAEDVAVADADVGVGNLFRRVDAPETTGDLTNANGDYTLGISDGRGRQRVTVVGEQLAVSAQSLSVAGAGSAANSTTNCVLDVSRMGNAAVTIKGAATVTAAAPPILQFEASDDSGTTWFAVDGVQSGTGSVEKTVYFSAGMSRLYNFMCSSITTLRVRLATNNPASGTIDVRITGTGMINDPAPSVTRIRGNLATYTAVYRLAAVNAAGSLSFAQVANTDKQWATIHHLSTSTKLVKIRKVEFNLTVAGAVASAEIMVDLRRINSTPVTGNPAITPQQHNPADGAAEAACLALPGTPATDAAAAVSVNAIAITTPAAGAVPTTPSIWSLWDSSTVDPDTPPLFIRPYTLEGYSIWIRSVAALTLKGIVRIVFSEE